MDLVSAEDKTKLDSLGLTVDHLQPQELDAWLDHVALVFENTGRGYFEDHFRCKPDYASVLVVKTLSTNVIVSTMRIFDHQITYGVRDMDVSNSAHFECYF